jgi:hypothetical protein
MQKIEFEFPDPDDNLEIELEPSSAVPLGEDAPETQPELKTKPEPETEDTPELDDVDIEVVDDTPEIDQGREPSEPPEDVTDEELENYSKKVAKRLKHFSKTYHDERRAKEAIQRERDELEQYTRRLVGENKRLQDNIGQSQSAMLEQAKTAVDAELDQAKKAYKDAYEAGNSEDITEAQERITKATFRKEQLQTVEVRAPLQEDTSPVQQEVTHQQRPQADPRAKKWADKNTWFGQTGKDQMTALALGYHSELIQSGISPTSDEYYELLDARMRSVFPDEFEDTPIEESEEPKRKKSVVAPATRSTAPKKVTLTKTQVQLAKRLGVPLELYAKQVAEEMRKEHG